MMQLTFAPNGNIKPCPWVEDCLNFPAGCSGESYWCKRFNTSEDIKGMRKAKGDFMSNISAVMYGQIRENERRNKNGAETDKCK